MLQSEDEDTNTCEIGNWLTITTVNIAAARPKIELIAKWDSDVILLQETKMSSTAIAEGRDKLNSKGWTLKHGTPCKVIKRTTKRTAAAATEAARGGVAAVLRNPRTPVPTPTTKLMTELRATGRWEEIVLPAKASTAHVGAATTYGVTGAASNPRAYKENEALLAKAVLRLIEFGDAPYLIAGDINIEPCDSEVLAGAIEVGIIIDIGHAARRGREPDLTYKRSGP